MGTARESDPPMPTATLEDRLWPKVDAGGDCWEWLAGRSDDGYGVFHVGRRPGRPRQTGAHRAVWEVLVGPIPDGLEIDHRCRNRGCVNPDHLEVVDDRVNALRGFGACGQHARQAVCINGHDLSDPANILPNPPGKDWRRCRECFRDVDRARDSTPERREQKNRARRARRADPDVWADELAKDRAWRAANRDRINARKRARRAAAVVINPMTPGREVSA